MPVTKHDPATGTFRWSNTGKHPTEFVVKDHWRHRLARVRSPLYSENELGILAMGWTVIATIAFILVFPC